MGRIGLSARKHKLVAGDGFEPSLTVSETAILPLDDPALRVYNYTVKMGIC